MNQKVNRDTLIYAFRNTSKAVANKYVRCSMNIRNNEWIPTTQERNMSNIAVDVHHVNEEQSIDSLADLGEIKIDRILVLVRSFKDFMYVHVVLDFM